MRRRATRSDALTLLELEHQRLEQLLAVLERTMMEEKHPGDSTLVHQALVYLHEYPDACHHPKEDLIARRIRAVLQNTDGLVDIEEDHRTLRELTANALQSMTEEADAESLRATLRGYVSDYREHIADENAQFFPEALRTLSQDDLDDIDFQVFDAPDPIFDGAEEERFATLRSELLEGSNQAT